MAGNDDRDSELMTSAEVAARFRVDPKTVNRWTDAGKLDAIRTPGGHRRFLASQVNELLKFPEDQGSD